MLNLMHPGPTGLDARVTTAGHQNRGFFQPLERVYHIGHVESQRNAELPIWQVLGLLIEAMTCRDILTIVETAKHRHPSSPKMASSKTQVWNLRCRSGDYKNKMNRYSVKLCIDYAIG
ncbi:hypothetical protein V2G26_016986 [Clonostachys chloroleuca]